ncbi:MAG: hypothetical protein JXA98_05030 [Methanosarcinaceae archaeon]|nr:hypothetical protein [Methanosarcinaceae archaeon]
MLRKNRKQIKEITGMATEYINIILTGLITAPTTLILAYAAYSRTVESRIKDLEHEVQLLEPLKNILQQVGSEQAEKVFKGWDK